jgi:hypothetical protein
MKNKTRNVLLWLAVFSIAMGLLESAVVIYLRALYYPEGFAFPLKQMDGIIALTEILREAATLLMLIGIGAIAGRNKTEKFGFFLFTFALWDIFYYIFLKILLHWPESWLTWDILFLLPTTWVGPVIAPILLSHCMVFLSLAISYYTDKQKILSIRGFEWLLLIMGSLIVIFSFTKEYVTYLLQEFQFPQVLILNENLMNYAIQFVPEHFPWFWFILGTFIICSGIGSFVYRNAK